MPATIPHRQIYQKSDYKPKNEPELTYHRDSHEFGFLPLTEARSQTQPYHCNRDQSCVNYKFFAYLVQCEEKL